MTKTRIIAMATDAKHKLNPYKWWGLIIVIFLAVTFAVVIIDARRSVGATGPSEGALVSFFGTLTIVITAIANPGIRKVKETMNSSFDGVKDELAKFTQSNADQHSEIVTKITSIESTVRVPRAQYDLKTELNDIMAEVLEFSPNDRISKFIDTETRRLTKFCMEAMETHIDNCSIPQIMLKLASAASQAREECKSVLGFEFAKVYTEMQIPLVESYAAQIKDIAEEQIFNAKIRTFSHISPKFLQDLLRATMKLYIAHPELR